MRSSPPFSYSTHPQFFSASVLVQISFMIMCASMGHSCHLAYVVVC